MEEEKERWEERLEELIKIGEIRRSEGSNRGTIGDYAGQCSLLFNRDMFARVPAPIYRGNVEFDRWILIPEIWEILDLEK